jgi:hypothetical protein
MRRPFAFTSTRGHSAGLPETISRTDDSYQYHTLQYHLELACVHTPERRPRRRMPGALLTITGGGQGS